ncbi:hypothetical protein RF11_03598 [Thelohanellus kitauei]|uniref:Uncharacterized protein n=1 Tax=Thelohanellus kitauei TaxID=669202 RepID=A0A0C2MIL5_THEKT|nr:hypothetical protein RF11_03598 [Thelohanellus kitauei]
MSMAQSSLVAPWLQGDVLNGMGETLGGLIYAAAILPIFTEQTGIEVFSPPMRGKVPAGSSPFSIFPYRRTISIHIIQPLNPVRAHPHDLCKMTDDGSKTSAPCRSDSPSSTQLGTRTTPKAYRNTEEMHHITVGKPKLVPRLRLPRSSDTSQRNSISPSQVVIAVQASITEKSHTAVVKH